MRVLAAMSGGVDSSVAAARLLDQGHEVVGVTLKLWGGDSDSGCCSVADVDDARRVAQQLGIDHYVFAYGDLFESAVVGPYVDAHAAGRTPNPCIDCNRHLKFGALLDRARVLGFDAVATGHHARVVATGDGLRVGRGVDRAKDQSYVLHHLRAPELDCVLFPIGGLTKDEVRAAAGRLGLRTSTKPESQDLCFVTRSEGRAAFLGRRIPLHPADAVDDRGRVVGRVDAVELVTVGQRKGLGVAQGERRYAVAVDVAGRRVTVGTAADLDGDRQPVTGFRWAGAPVDGEVVVQTSAHGRAHGARIEGGPGEAVVVWSRPRSRTAPGQALVAYAGDVVVGGGTAA